MIEHWLFEDGVGEKRAALIDNGEIVEALIERDEAGPRPGAIVDARLVTILVPGRRGVVLLASGEEALIEPLPPSITQGAAIRVEIVREALPERGRPKLARARVTGDLPGPAPTLLGRIEAGGIPVRPASPSGKDSLDACGWTELIEHSQSGEIDFPGGRLRMSLTPAMTLFDVDGALPPGDLAVAGAAAAGRSIRRLGIGGSIGIDLPTLPGKAERQAAAAALDAVLPQPFERTAVNGFGFLQIVRRRTRASLPELIQADAALAAALSLLRAAERVRGAGARTIAAAPAVIARIEARHDWIRVLERRIGAAIVLLVDPALTISAGHVHATPL